MSLSMRRCRRHARALSATAAAVAVALVSTLIGVVQSSPAGANSTASATVNGNTTYQRITGFGSSEAFLEANIIMGAAHGTQNKVLKLLYSTKTSRNSSPKAVFWRTLQREWAREQLEE